jgi:hypothetical protein
MRETMARGQKNFEELLKSMQKSKRVVQPGVRPMVVEPVVDVELDAEQLQQIAETAMIEKTQRLQKLIASIRGKINCVVRGALYPPTACRSDALALTLWPLQLLKQCATCTRRNVHIQQEDTDEYGDIATMKIIASRKNAVMVSLRVSRSTTPDQRS